MIKQVLVSAGLAAIVLTTTLPQVQAAEITEIEWEVIPEGQEVSGLHQTCEEYLQRMDCSVPEYLWWYFEDAGERYNIRPELLAAIAWRESRFDPEAYNGGCIGLMQVSARWHSGRMHGLGFDDLWNVQANIMTGADYLAEILRDQPDIYRALMTYNGDTRQEISQYAKEVVAVSIALQITRE